MRIPNSIESKSKIKKIIKVLLPDMIYDLYSLYINIRPIHKRKCPICDYYGYFKNSGRPPRIDALCPKCKSLERHRLFWLWIEKNKNELSEPILHFAAEPIFENMLRESYKDYITADLYNQADIKIDIENIDIDGKIFKTIICHQVLEHVDDKKALNELYKIISDDGLLILSVPIIMGWDKTYENKSIKDSINRELHFGQSDHLRYYGRDITERIYDAGFKNIRKIVAEGEDVIKYGLLRGETIFLVKK